MSNIYLGYHFIVEPKELGSEILVAELGELPFESFVDSEFGVTAYIQKNLWNENIRFSVGFLKFNWFSVRCFF